MRFHFRGGITNHQYVRPEQRELARANRRTPTPAEAATWELLRARRMLGLKFCRQQVIDGFIVDFFCAERGLVVEIDGRVHDDPEAIAYDREREAIFRCRGLKLVRIRNEGVSQASIKAAITNILAEPPPLPKGEGAGG